MDSDVAETPTPPVLRVTDPRTITAESPPVGKRKDPKKVAAGRLGAAAQKAKRERLLEELRVAKEALWGPKDTSGELVEGTADGKNRHAL